MAVGTLALCLGSCGGGGGGGVTNPPPVTQPPAPLRSVLSQGSVMLDAPSGTSTFASAIFFTNVIAGELEITVDWTQPTNTMWVLVSQGVCSIDQLVQGGCPDGPSCGCQFVVRSLESTPKPRVFRVPNAAAGSRTLIVWNQGPGSETASYNVILIN